MLLHNLAHTIVSPAYSASNNLSLSIDIANNNIVTDSHANYIAVVYTELAHNKYPQPTLLPATYPHKSIYSTSTSQTTYNACFSANNNKVTDSHITYNAVSSRKFAHTKVSPAHPKTKNFSSSIDTDNNNIVTDSLAT